MLEIVPLSFLWKIQSPCAATVRGGVEDAS